MNNYFKIGKMAATFGVQGEVILEHSLGKKTSLKGLETIFIEERKDSASVLCKTGWYYLACVLILLQPLPGKQAG